MLKRHITLALIMVNLLIACTSEEHTPDNTEEASNAQRIVQDSIQKDTLIVEETPDEYNSNEVQLSNGDTLYSIANNWNQNT